MLNKRKIQELEWKLEDLTRENEFLKKELVEYAIVSNGHYTRTPPDYADIFTIEEFILDGCVGYSSDGMAIPIKDGMEDNSIYFSKNCMWRLPIDATHVAWYNK